MSVFVDDKCNYGAISVTSLILDNQQINETIEFFFFFNIHNLSEALCEGARDIRMFKSPKFHRRSTFCLCFKLCHRLN